MASQSTSYAHNLELVKKGWLVDTFWSNTGDDRVSKGCLANSSQGWIQLEQPFTSGHLHPPRFPGCRCSISFKILGKDPNFKETKDENVDTSVKSFETLDIPPIHREDLTESSKETITEWVKNSKYINAAARFGKNAEEFKENPEKYIEANKQMQELESTISNESLKQSYDVKRGLQKYDIDRAKLALEKLKLGKTPEITDNGFTSVSFNEDSHLNYAIPDENDEIWVYVSTLDKGVPALFIGNENSQTLGFKKEGEILINRNTKYYIIGETIIPTVEKDKATQITHMVDIIYEFNEG